MLVKMKTHLTTCSKKAFLCNFFRDFFFPRQQRPRLFIHQKVIKTNVSTPFAVPVIGNKI